MSKRLKFETNPADHKPPAKSKTRRQQQRYPPPDDAAKPEHSYDEAPRPHDSHAPDGAHTATIAPPDAPAETRTRQQTHPLAPKPDDAYSETTVPPPDTPVETRERPADPLPPEPPPPSDGKLKFSKEEKAVSKLEGKADKYDKKLEKAQSRLPTETVKEKERLFDEKTKKTTTQLRFTEKPVPIHEAPWNKPQKKPISRKITGAATTAAVNKIHSKVYEVEHENVGTQAAHRAELMGESAYRGGKRVTRSAYRFHKNRPYRKASKLEVKSVKNQAKLSYQKALRDNPKLASNPVSRLFQKRAIKRRYATARKAAQNSAKTVKGSVGIAKRASNLVRNITRRNPIFLLKCGLLLLIIFFIMAVFSMCQALFSGTTAAVSSVFYVAEYEDIDDAEIAYGEWTVDLQIYVNSITENYPGFDEYRFDVGQINYNPFELMAYLTAVYGPFTFAEVEPTLRELFAQQYQLSIVPTVEIRTRTETRIDSQGNTYTVQVQYEWRVLNVTLASTPLSLVLFTRMTFEEWQHFNILMVSRGARQFVGNPFDRNWLPHVSSRYGYRVHPIHGDKRFHFGIDIALPTGTEILAGFDGTVTRVGYDEDGWGNFVVIDNGAGVQALYAHCHTVVVSQGQGISEGDVIATVGTTGSSTGPHLHMEVIRNGRHLNPLFFVVTGEEASIQFGNARPLTPEEFAILYAEARSHLGKPYIYGANGPNAFDCSSFVCWVYTHSGIFNLPRTTAQGVFNQTTPIPPSAIRPGDIIFFTRTYSTTDVVTHLGICVGNGQMIHAGSPVGYANIHAPFWQTHFFAVGRLPW